MGCLATEALDAAIQLDRVCRGVALAPPGVNALADRLSDLDLDDPFVVDVLHDVVRRAGHAPETVAELGETVAAYADTAAAIGCGEPGDAAGLMRFLLALHGRLLESSPSEAVAFAA